ncbi:MAG: hypothetical protein LQ340_000492 [Diploschistes diacapsis]|nr:MAG: hypothetical protein LQ340_000492 [Diploschistes diacapsis]
MFSGYRLVVSSFPLKVWITPLAAFAEPTNFLYRCRFLHFTPKALQGATTTSTTNRQCEFIKQPSKLDSLCAREGSHGDSLINQDIQPAPGIAEAGLFQSLSITDTKHHVPTRHEARGGTENSGVVEESPKALLKGLTGTSVQQTFKLRGAQLPRLLSKVREKRDMQKFGQVKSSVMKEKGSWSYDWRIPLLELRRNFERSSAPLADLDTFVAPSILYRQFADVEVFKPSTWSQGSFAEYVNNLAQSQVSRLMQKHLYTGRTTHVSAVKDTLLFLFRDEELQPCVSTLAFENALRFFYRHSLISDARTLFNIMVERRIPIRTETFNMALRAAAGKKDLHNYTYLLRAMINQGLRPNEGTWVSLVIVLESHAAKVAVIENMRQLDLLSRADVIQAVAVDLLSSQLGQPAGVDSDATGTMQVFDSEFGDSWFSPKAGNVICEHLCKTGRPEQAVQFLETMVKRACRPNRGTLDILLTHCLMVLDDAGALRLLKLFWHEYQVGTGGFSYHVLFMIGWHIRSYNLCRVVWWAACIEGEVTYRMQELTMRSLLRNTPVQTKNMSKVWMKEVGKVIVGIKPSGRAHEKSKMSENKNVSTRHNIEGLAAWASSEEDRFAQVGLANHAMRADLSAFKVFRLYVADFHQAFADAVERDGEWRKHGYQSMSLSQKIREAVQIPVRYKVRWFGAPERKPKHAARREQVLNKHVENSPE